MSDQTFLEKLDALSRSCIPFDRPDLHQGYFRWRDSLTLVSQRKHQPMRHRIAALIGPTGVGKSTFVNALLFQPSQQPLVQTSVLRPCTRKPAALGTKAALEELSADPILGFLKEDIEKISLDTANSLPKWTRQWCLIDTPDFDSHSQEHKVLSEAILLRADAVLFIVNPSKYADAAVWKNIEKMADLGNAAAFIMNRSHDEALADFKSKLRAYDSFAQVPVLSMPAIEIEQKGDEPSSLSLLLNQSAISITKPVFNSIASDSELEKRAEKIEKTYRKQVSAWLKILEQEQQKTSILIKDEKEIFLKRLRAEVPLQIDEALRRQLIRRFNSEVDKIDILRVPRQWVSRTWSQLRDWLPGRGTQKEDEALAPAEILMRGYRYGFEEFSFRYARQLKERMLTTDFLFVNTKESTPNNKETLPKNIIGEGAPLWPNSEKHEALLVESFSELQKTIEAESQRIAEGLPWASRFGFYGAQLAVHAVALLLFIKTGGLSGGEVAIQGLSSPILAQIVRHLISEGEAAAVESRLLDALFIKLTSEWFKIFTKTNAFLSKIEEQLPTKIHWQDDFLWSAELAEILKKSPRNHDTKYIAEEL